MATTNSVDGSAGRGNGVPFFIWTPRLDDETTMNLDGAAATTV